MPDISIAKFKMRVRKRLYLDQYKDISCAERRHHVCRAQIFVLPYVIKKVCAEVHRSESGYCLLTRFDKTKLNFILKWQEEQGEVSSRFVI